MNLSPQYYLFSRTEKSGLKFKVRKLKIQTYIPEINKIRGKPNDNFVTNLTLPCLFPTII